jgi:hypothetical protein
LKKAEQKVLNFLLHFVDFVLFTRLDSNHRKQEISIDNQRHKKGQNAMKTAILAAQEIAPRGFEPLLPG